LAVAGKGHLDQQVVAGFTAVVFDQQIAGDGNIFAAPLPPAIGTGECHVIDALGDVRAATSCGEHRRWAALGSAFQRVVMVLAGQNAAVAGDLQCTDVAGGQAGHHQRLAQPLQVVRLRRHAGREQAALYRAFHLQAGAAAGVLEGAAQQGLRGHDRAQQQQKRSRPPS
jgi:hypothetical protein